MRAASVLEDQAMNMAVHGLEEVVVSGGKVVMFSGKPLTRKVFDPAMVRFLLAHLNPEKYGDKRVIELKLEDWDGNLDRLSDESLKALLTKLEEKLALEEAKEAAALPAGQVIDGECENVTE
jgi:hypothetical protein